MNEFFRLFAAFYVLFYSNNLLFVSSQNTNKVLSLSCDFQNDYCNWKNTTGVGNLFWIRNKTDNYRDNFSPPGDHTIGKDGYYLQINTALPTQKNWIGRLISPEIATTSLVVFTQTNCFSFWYFMYGSGLSTLSIYLIPNNVTENSPRWMKTGSQGKSWNFGRVEFNMSTQTTYKILIEGKSGGLNGDIALDDISFDYQQCEEETNDVTCDFENDFICGYKKEQGIKNAEWVRYTGLPDTTQTGPSTDVTTGTLYGHFMLFDASSYNASAVARISSPFVESASGKGCLEFYYNSNGADVNKLIVYTVSNSVKKSIFTSTGNLGRPWRIARVNLELTNKFQIQFEAYRGNGIRGDIAIDDVLFKRDVTCPNVYDCDFESDCTWKNEKDEKLVQLTWIINSGSTPSIETGPSTDSTNSINGHYAYIESSFPAKFGDKARLQSAVLLETKSSCLKFMYHMFGGDTGSLNIFLKSINAGIARPAKLVWSLDGPQGNKWLSAQVPIQFDEPFLIFIDGIVGNGAESDIAIDAITLTNSTCTINPSKAEPSNSSISCTFEKDQCGWYHDVNSNFAWIRNRPLFSTSSNIAPSIDHTLQTPNGYYMLILTSKQKPNDKGRLVSEAFLFNNTIGCFQFWYHKNGFDSGSLNVYLRKSDGTLGPAIWTKKGNFGNRWRLGKIDVRKTSYNGYFTFEGVIDKGLSGDISIDDVSFEPGAYCKESVSISCDFEDTLCGYVADKSSGYYWKQTNSTPFNNLLDHTTNTENGYFMSTQKSTITSNNNNTARLYTPLANGTNEMCLQFYYSLLTSDVLNIYLSTSSQSGNEYFLWSSTSDSGNQWIKGLSNLNVPTYNSYQLIFEGVVSNNLALDDVFLSVGKCSHIGDCNFENDDFCEWQSLSPTVPITTEWITTSGGSNYGSNINVDHTLGTSFGKYLFFETDYFENSNLAKIQSPEFEPVETYFCMEFWYVIDGNSNTLLSIFQKNSKTKTQTTLWRIKGSQGMNWLRAAIPLDSEDYFSIIIQGSNFLSMYDFHGIAIDDIVFTKEYCNHYPAQATVSPITTSVTKTSTTTSEAPLNSTSTSFDCDFEASKCGWTSDLTSNFEWERLQGKNNVSKWHPSIDFTTASADGWFMSIDSSIPNRKGFKARLNSPLVTKSGNSVHCLTFAYFMYGDNVGSLIVYMSTIFDGLSLKYNFTGSKGNQWIKQLSTITFATKLDFQIIFEGVIGDGNKGSIALDDIQIKDGSCSKNICDFESKEICNYTNDVFKTNFNWTRNSGPTSSSDTGPSVDHTTQTSSGHYMFIESSYPQKVNHIARLLTPLVYSNKHCLEFYYHMWGNGGGILNILTKSSNGQLSLPLWTRNKNYGDNWNLAQLTVSSPSLSETEIFQVAFEGIVGNKTYYFEGDIAIDDIKIEKRECPSLGFCDFETFPRLCTWSNVEKGDDFDWEEGDYLTSSLGLGPSVDHTFGNKNGHYIFIDCAKKEGNQAWLSSLIFSETKSRCMRFWYSLNGNNIGTLRVELIYENNAKDIIWQLSSDKGSQWLQGTVGFNSKNMTYRIQIVGIRGSNDKGNIAIDDISFIESQCSISPAEVNNELAQYTTTPKITTQQTTTQQPTASDQITCNFDQKNKCGWIDDSMAELKWILNKYSTSSSDTGPISDVSGSGYYIYLESSFVKQGDKARLLSPLINDTMARNEHCLQFYYHLYGDEIGELNVQLQSSIGLTGNSIWKRNQQHGNIWLKAHITIPVSSNIQNYRIAIEAIVGKGARGDVAIDEIAFYSNQRCSPVSEFGSLISHYCDFESSDVCGYQIDNLNLTSSVSWKRSKADGIPDKDNTYQTRNGYFMQYKTSQQSMVSRFITPEFSPAETGRCLGFYLFGNGFFRLNVFARVDSNESLLFTYFSPTTLGNGDWLQIETEIPESILTDSSSYEIIFEGNSLILTNIGIDDVSLKKGLCRKSPGDCDFENAGFCSWTNLDNDDFDWLLHQGSTPTWDTGPSVDHTLNSINGTYIYIESSIPRKKNEKAWLVSEVFNTVEQNSICFTFWYHALGLNVGSLNIYIADSNLLNRTHLWQIQGQQSTNSKDWKKGVLPVDNIKDDYSNLYVILIEGTIGNGYDADIGIDDIVFLNYSSSCVFEPSNSMLTYPTSKPATTTPSIYDGIICDFEKDFCGWSQLSSSDVNWVRKTGKQPNGPKFDHTYNSNSSYYIFFESEFDYYDYYDYWRINLAKLKSPKIDGNVKQCLGFWYHMYGSNVGKLSVYYYIDKGNNIFEQTRLPVWSKKENHGDHWLFAQISYPGGNQSIANFIIEGYADYGSYGDIAIDDIGFKYGECESPDFVSVTCDFEEQHICGYESDEKADFNWARNKGNTLTAQTGPSFDVTTGTGSGFYMFIETSDPQQRDDKARLKSPVQNFKTGKCLIFYYHAYGADIGALKVYSEIQTNQTVKPLNTLWIIDQNQGNNWFIARIPTDYTDNFRIIFEGIVGKSNLGDVAIDDIFMSPDYCKQPANCNFEDKNYDFCSWLNLNNSIDDFDWKIYSADLLPQFGSGIPDNTLQSINGHFMIANGVKSGHYARLFSEYLQPTSVSGICFSFYFYFNGNSGFRLEVSLAENNQSNVTIWSMIDTQSTSRFWQNARVKLLTSKPYRINLDAYLGSDQKNFIGVDDIVMVPGSGICNTIPIVAKPQDLTSTSTLTTTLSTQQSIKELSCNFETPCSWNNGATNFNWIVVNGSTSANSFKGPSVDHSLNTEAGMLLTPNVLSSFATYSTANYYSPVVSGSKCVEFYYYLYGSEVGELSLYRENTVASTRGSKLWTRSKSSEPKWLFGSANYNPLNQSEPYRFNLALVTGLKVFKGFVGIDDIVVHDGSCSTTDLCDFETNDMCNYENDPLADFKWERSQGYKFENSTFEIVDHTYGTLEGNFMLMNTFINQNIGSGRFISPIQRQTAGSCVHFFYFTSGSSDSKLRLFAKIANNLGSHIWSVDGPTGDIWQQGQASVNSFSDTWQAVFEGVRTSSANGMIAIDDVRITRGNCPNQGDCNFEDGTLCEYENLNEAEMKWTVRRGSGPNAGTGPNVDHTLNAKAGAYAILDTSKPIKKNDKGQMKGEIFSGSEMPTCIRFWYYMKAVSASTSFGTLNVLKYTYNSNTNTTLWSLKYGQAAQWMEGRLAYVETSSHSVIFEGIRGTDLGDIAIDDISFFPFSNCSSTDVSVQTAAPTLTSTPSRIIYPLTTISYPSSSLDCNFDMYNMCSWINDTSANFNWTINKGKTVSLLTGPEADHTTESINGHYIFIEASSPQKQNDAARLISQSINIGINGGCFKFFYHMFGANIYKLNIYLQTGNNPLGKAVWQKQGNKGNVWLFGHFYIDSSMNNLKLIIEGVVGNGFMGDIALDDFSFNDGSCPTTNTCDFEQSDLCGYVNDINTGFLWNRVQGSNSEPDHSYNTETGHYMIAKSTVLHSQNKVARLFSPSYPATTLCVSFWYKSTGDIQFNVRTYSFGNLNSKLAYSATGSRGNEWSLGQATVSYQASYQIAFEAIDLGPSFNDGSVWLDDIEVNYKECKPLGSCDFEDGICGFTNSINANFSWVRLDGAFGLGQNNWDSPTYDHTTGSSAGYLMYLDTNNNPQGQNALLESGIITQKSGYKCVQFFTKTNSNNTATLNLKRKDKITGAISNLFSLSGKEDIDAWVFKEVQLPANNMENINEPYSFIFEGVVGTSSGQLAFDDVELYDGKCNGQEIKPDKFDCGGGTLIEFFRVCDFIIDCPTHADELKCGSCDFENPNTCGWTNNSTGNYKWVRSRNGSLSNFTGPEIDHTFGTNKGYYMNIESQSTLTVSPASLYSPLIPRASSSCQIKFWMIFTGGSGTFYIDLFIGGKREGRIFRTSGTPVRSNWTEIIADLGSIYTDFQIVIAASKSFSKNNVISIDDVKFENCALPLVTPGITCSSNETKCLRGNCVSNERICDFVDDCGDKTDETLPICNSYQKCSFEYSFCDWTYDSANNLRWQRRSGTTVTSNTGPDRDHTTGLDGGYYLFLDAFGFYNKKSNLYSKNYVRNSNKECRFIFYYHMFGDQMGSLSIYIRYSKDENLNQKLWSVSGNQGERWLRNAITLNTLANKPFQIVIEGLIGTGYRSDIAIDDTAFSPECLPYNNELPLDTTTSTATNVQTETSSNSINSIHTTLMTSISVQSSSSSSSSTTNTRTVTNSLDCNSTVDYCKNGGKCIFSFDGLSCVCLVGYTGEFCEINFESKNEKKSNNVGLGLGFGLGIPVIIVLAIGLFIFYRKYKKNNSDFSIFKQKTKTYSTMKEENDNTNPGISNPIFGTEDNDLDIDLMKY